MDNEFNCEHCGAVVNEADDFCPDCGGLFIEDAKCVNHPELNAEAVCVICMEPYCKICIGSGREIYLCCRHENYEIIEGYTKVYGTLDALDAEYIKSVLAGEGLHPFVFKRKASPIHVGYENHTLFRSAGEKPGHSVNEYKVMAPFQEALKAEKIISELNED